MSVKGIFKTLALALILPAVLIMFIELYNVMLTSASLNKIIRLSVNKSCEFFTQETYKIASDGTTSSGKTMATKASNIKAADGSKYIDGDFYGSTDPYDIWESIYCSDRFRSTLSDIISQVGTPWQALESLEIIVNDPDYYPSETPDWDWSEEQMLDYSIKSQAVTFKENLYTPINMGIPYIDEEVTNKIFKWQLTQMLSNCDSDLIQKDEYGKNFVNYKGFACYCDSAKITNLEYTVYDIGTSSGRDGLRKAIGYVPLVNNAGGQGIALSGDERDMICVVSMEYSMPVRYIGATKTMGKVFNYVWDKEVNGYDWGTGLGSTYRSTDQSYDTTGIIAKGGGDYDEDNIANSIPLTGKLYYMIVR